MKNDSQIKYYAKKLLADLKCERIQFEYSTDKLSIVALNGQNIVKKYVVEDRQRFQKARKCNFLIEGRKRSFSSITEAARNFGIGRTLLQYYMNNNMWFFERKKGRGIEFVGYE